MEKPLPAIPAKRYFTIGEVSELCGVKPYVLRYWEQEFTQLKPMKRRGNRRYYQHHEVLLIRRIRELLYDQGFTISGARNRLADLPPAPRLPLPEGDEFDPLDEELLAAAAAPRSTIESAAAMLLMHPAADRNHVPVPMPAGADERSFVHEGIDRDALRRELLSIRDLLSV
jgi:DNA-binding transcriptional MerR regulator